MQYLNKRFHLTDKEGVSVNLNKSVIIDIDETLIDTLYRRQAAWKHVLGIDIPIEVINRYQSKVILARYAQDKSDIWRTFWKTLLCYEQKGVLLLQLDKPMRGAVKILNKWAKYHKVIYLTARTQNMKEYTLKELAEMGFPIKNIDIWMSPSFEDFLSNLLGVRVSLLNEIMKKNEVVRIIDDNPLYFRSYMKAGIPERIGLMYNGRYEESDYKGATKIIKNWSELS